MRIYFIRRTEKPRAFYLKYEIVHESNGKYSFDGYAITRIGAKIRAKQLIFEDLIKEI